MQAIAEFKIADLVPLQGQISYDDIATQTLITSEMTARLLRYAMTMRIFHEPEPGMVAHTAASRALSHSPANDWLRSGTQEMWPAAVKVLTAFLMRGELIVRLMVPRWSRLFKSGQRPKKLMRR